MNNKNKMGFWKSIIFLSVIWILISYFLMDRFEEGSSEVRLLIILMIIPILLIIIGYNFHKKAKAESLNLTVDKYNQQVREQVERRKEEWKEAKQPRISSEGKVVCPRCASSNIQIVKRGWKVTTGFIGSGKNERVCVNCLKKF